jgi:ElaB/YqjD/DUF883 family membrane-anchored ribosome-binding protein
MATMDKNTSIGELVTDAEALLSKLGDVKSPDIQALRDKVEAGIADAKKSLSRQVHAGTERLQDLTESVVDYVKENPWVAVAAGTAIAVALMYIAFSGRSEDD